MEAAHTHLALNDHKASFTMLSCKTYTVKAPFALGRALGSAASVGISAVANAICPSLDTLALTLRPIMPS